LAKVIACGKDREEARRRLIRGLKNTRVLGLTTNKSFLIALLREDTFINGEATTSFIDEELLTRTKPIIHLNDIALVAALLQQNNNSLGDWSNADPFKRFESLRHGDETVEVGILLTPKGYDISVRDELVSINDLSCHDGDVVYCVNNVTKAAVYYINESNISIDVGERVVNFQRLTYQPVLSKDNGGSGNVNASTEGLVIDVLVKEGDKVKRGDTLVLIEAMKMEHRHLATGDGTVAAVNVEKGEQVKNRQSLVEIELLEVEVESA